MTPLDIRQRRFRPRLFRGADIDEVGAFLDYVAEEYEAALSESKLLKVQLAALGERERILAGLEQALRDLITVGQRTSEGFTANAYREAQLIVDWAPHRGERLLDEARAEEVRIKEAVKDLECLPREAIQAVRATIDRFRRLLEIAAPSDDERPAPIGAVQAEGAAEPSSPQSARA